MTPLPSDADAPLTPDEEHALREAWPRTAEALRSMAQRANTARGASWEHGARCATHLLNAVGAVGHLLATLDEVRRERTELAARTETLESEIVALESALESDVADVRARETEIAEVRREKAELAARVDGAVARADLLRDVARHERDVYAHVIARLRDALRLDAGASLGDVVQRAEELAARGER